ncbi:MAG: phosphodiester glycosidase family protein [Defluviitaleaceae bacterium]|nr:phosphodiester glycosidase family protein [Defluviitaleaceae bacterium]
MKKIVSVFIFCAVSLASLGFVQTIFAADIFFEHSTIRHPSRGVEYERLTQMTSVGLRDVHILRIPLDDPYIDIAPVASLQGVGFRESASALLSAAGAVAGVNADYFHMTPTYAVHLGPMISDGQLLAAQTETNRYSDSLAAFLLDRNNNPFFEYMRIDIHVYHGGVRGLRVNYFNNIGTTMEEPVVFTCSAMRDTAALDIRFPFTSKVVSDGASVVYVTSLPGETVEIPEGGFVIVFPERMAGQRLRYMAGDTLTLSIRNNLYIDLSAIQTGIGGAGMVLVNGEAADDGGYITTGRQPRTAVGISRDGKTLILITVDGRGTSVGATHTELAELIRRAGAHNAMHLDGGGSATMVVRENDRYNVVNTPSEGTQRRIVNALGIFDNARPGEMAGIALEMAQQRVAVNTPVASRVFARDALGLRFPMPEDAQLAYMADRDMGIWRDGYYTPLIAGEHTVHVWFGHMWAAQTIYVLEIAELYAAPVSLMNGEQRRLRFTGTGADGSTIPDVNVTQFNVVPASLGRVENGYFYAAGSGTGYIRAWVNNIVTYVPVSVGRVSAPIVMPMGAVSFSGYPAAFVTGDVRHETVGTHLIPRLTYTVKDAPETQAAHMVFDPPLEIPSSQDEVPTALRLQVHGDGSGHWLRARVADGNGTTHNINFTQNADFVGWETLTAQLPANVPGPFTVERIWMATLGAGEDAEHTVYFFNLQALYAPLPLPEIPRGSFFADPMQTHGAFTGIPGGGRHVFDLTFVTQAYRFRYEDDMAIIRLTANASGLTDRRQWEYVMRDVRAVDAHHVVIMPGIDPSAFPPLVYELFHAMVRTLADEGRLVFVVSPSPESAEVSLALRDGVRYIGGMEEIRFFTDGRQIWWYA